MKRVICLLSFLILAGCNSSALGTTGGPAMEQILALTGGSGTTASTAPTQAQRLRGIWIVGGFDGSSLVNKTDLFDPETNTYYPEAAGALTVPRAYLTLASAGGKLYAIGGVTAGGVPSNVVESLDLSQASLTWQVDAALGSARINPVAENLDDRLVVMMGSSTAVPALSGTIEELVAGSWNAASYAALAAGDQRLDGGHAAISGSIYLTGGRNATTARITAANGWVMASSNAGTAGVTGVVEPPLVVTVGNVHEQRWGCAGAAVSNTSLPGTLFVIGGNAANPTTNSYPVNHTAFTSSTAFVSQFRVGATTFQTSYNMLNTRVFPRAVVIESGAAPGLYVIGGANSSGPVAAIEYLPISGASIGAFTARATMTNPRYGHGASRVIQ